MSIENNYEILTYTATEGQTDFLVTWTYQEEDDIFFTINNSMEVREQEEYTVTEDGISLNTPLKNGDKVVIYRQTDLEQIVEFITNGKITATMLQNHSDNIFYILQELSKNSINAFNLELIKEIIPEVPDFQDYSKYGVSSGVVSGMKISKENNQLKIAEGLGFISNANRYNSYKEQITLTSLELTEPLYYTDFTGVTDGLKHVILSNNNFITLSETKAITTGSIYLGYCYVKNEVLSSVFSCPNVLSNSQERLNNHIDNNIKFENVNLSLQSTPNALGLQLEPNVVIYSAGNNYNGAINQFQQTNVDKLVTDFATNSFKQFGYNNDGTAQELVELNSVNINRNIIDKIDDETNNYSDKNLIDTWQNLRICLSKKGELAVTRGQKDYANKEEALEGLLVENFVIQPSYKEFTPIYALTIKEGATDYSDVELTNLLKEVEFDYIQASPVGTIHKLHPSVAEKYDILIECDGDQETLIGAYPDLDELEGYTLDSYIEGFSLDESVDYSADIVADNAAMGFIIDNNAYYLKQDFLYEFNGVTTSLTNKGEITDISTNNWKTVGVKSLSDVMISNNSGYLQRYNFSTLTAIDSVNTATNARFPYIIDYNENINKWVIIGFKSSSSSDQTMYIETTIDNQDIITEYADETFGKPIRNQYFSKPIAPNKDSYSYLDGNYYIVTQRGSILELNENNLSNPKKVYEFEILRDTTSTEPFELHPITTKGNTILCSGGYIQKDNDVNKVRLVYSLNKGKSWQTKDVSIPNSESLNIEWMELLEDNTLVIYNSGNPQHLILVNNFNNQVVDSKLIIEGSKLATVSSIFVFKNKSLLHIGRSSTSGDKRDHYFIPFLNGSFYYDIPFIEGDYKGRYKYYLNKGK